MQWENIGPVDFGNRELIVVLGKIDDGAVVDCIYVGCPYDLELRTSQLRLDFVSVGTELLENWPVGYTKC